MRKLSQRVGTSVLAYVVLVGMLIGGVGVFGYAAPQSTVAIVNETSISQEEFAQEVTSRFGQIVLDQMIRERLVMQQVNEAGLTISSEQVSAEMEAIQSQFQTAEEFARALKEAGHTVESLKREIQVEIGLQMLLADEIQVSDDELMQVYEQYKWQLGDASFADTKDQLYEVVWQDKFAQVSNTWLASKIAEAEIEVFLGQ